MMSPIEALMEPTTPATESSRGAFNRYVADILGIILGSSRLIFRDNVTPSGFRLRLHPGQETPVIPLEPRRSEDPLAATIEALLKLTVPEVNGKSMHRGKWTASFHGGASADGALATESPDNAEDYVFRYGLPAWTNAPSSLTEYLAALTSVVVDIIDFEGVPSGAVPTALVRDGAEQGSTSFAALALPRPQDTYDLGARSSGSSGRHPLQSIAQTEPTIVVLARHWALLKSFVRWRPQSPALPMSRVGTSPCQSAAGDEPTGLDGFSLRRTADWVVDGLADPSSVYQHLARVCNVTCKFCYLYGNPENIAVARAAKVVTSSELATRMRYYDPEKGRGLFHAQWEINEYLVDPKLPSILRALRSRSSEPFFFITNGSPLTEKVIDLLAELKPVSLVVSTNTLDAPLRAELMGENPVQNRTAMHCLSQLVDREIPFGVSLVAFPDVPLEELERTILILDELGVGFIRVNLPGQTASHPYQANFDTDTYWPKVVRWARELRPRLRVPLLCIPSGYEESFFSDDPFEARIIGTVLGSPAAKTTGLRPNDLVVRVGARKIRDRAELLAALAIAEGKTEIEVERGGENLVFELDPQARASFPYPGSWMFGKYLFPHGIVFAPTLHPGDAASIRRAMRGARSAVIVTSSIMEPTARAFVQRHASEVADRIRFVVPTCDFLGGNIRVLDMATIGDIAKVLEKDIREHGRPDVVLLPDGGFQLNGRDLSGRHYGDLARHFQCPVRLLTRTRQFTF